MQELPRTIAVSVLGTTSLHRDGVEVPLPAAKMRALLAVLTLELGHDVSVDRIVDALWGQQPPRSVHNTLQGYVVALRHALDPDRAARTPFGVLVTTGTHYRLALPPSAVDAERLVSATEDAAALVAQLPDPWLPMIDPELRPEALEVVTRLRLLLPSWRGDPYADLGDLPAAVAERARLEEFRTAAFESGLTLGLALGNVSSSLADLARVCAEHPYNERLAGLRALALARAARQAEALGVLAALRKRLIDELGIEPVAELGSVYLAILRSEPAVHGWAADPVGVQPGTW